MLDVSYGLMALAVGKRYELGKDTYLPTLPYVCT